MTTTRLPAALEALALDRTTTLLVPPEADRQPCGALFLWPAKVAHLANVRRKPPTLIPGTWWIVSWRLWEPGRLELLNPTTWRRRPLGTPQALPALELEGVVVKDRPQPVLETLGLVVRFQLEAVIWRRNLERPEPRRLRAVKLNPDGQNLVAHDLDRDAPRSFKLADLVGVSLAEGQPVPTWGPAGYELPGGDR